MNQHRVVVGAVTAVLALLALTAMHALPMSAAHSDGAVAEASLAAGAGAIEGAAATHSTDGVPPHGHSLLHLCVAVLVIGLSLALAASVRRRPLTNSPLARIAPARAVLTRDTGPPSLAGLCLLRC